MEGGRGRKITARSRQHVRGARWLAHFIAIERRQSSSSSSSNRTTKAELEERTYAAIEEGDARSRISSRRTGVEELVL